MAGQGEPAIPVDRHMARRVRARCDAAAQRQGARGVFVIANDVAPEFRLGDRPQQTLPIAADQERRIEFSEALPNSIRPESASITARVIPAPCAPAVGPVEATLYEPI